jgi:hypothetical protein
LLPFFGEAKKEGSPQVHRPCKETAGTAESESITVKRDWLPIPALPGSAKAKVQAAHTKAPKSTAHKKSPQLRAF